MTAEPSAVLDLLVPICNDLAVASNLSLDQAVEQVLREMLGDGGSPWPR